MSEFDPLIETLTSATKQMVTDAAKVATEASKKVNDDQLTARDLLLTMTELVNIAVGGGVRITRQLADTPPGARGIADYSRAVGRRMAKESRVVAKAATEKMDEGTYDIDDWVVSLTRMADIAVVGGMEIAQTLFAGPARFDSEPHVVDLQAPPGKTRRQFGEVVLRRYGPDDEPEIPRKRISFEPSHLEPGDTAFRMLIAPYQLTSGVYRGTVEVGHDIVDVEFAL